jgi:hypothetical protein
MTTPYTKYPVGNKQFVIEWNLVGDEVDPVQGEKFELLDCEPISYYTSGPSDPQFRLMLSNHSDPDTFRTFLVIGETFLSPLPDSFGNPPLPPTTRWLWPQLQGGVENQPAVLAVLFRELI